MKKALLIKLKSFVLGVMGLLLISTNGFAQRVSATGGTYTIDTAGLNTGTNFKTFTDAITDLNLVGTFTGNVVFNVVAGQEFYENTPIITATGTSTGSITFQKNGSGANPTIRPSGTTGTMDFGFCLQGSDYFTFDGINIISDGSAVEYGFRIINATSTNGAMFNTFKNFTILLDRTNTTTRAIIQSAYASYAGAVTAASTAGANHNNSYLNFTIGNSNSAFWIYAGSTTYRDTNTVIATTSPSIYNNVGRANVPDDIGGNIASTAYCFYLYYQNALQLKNTIIQNVSNATTLYGIYSSTTDRILITNNRYNNVKTTGTFYGCYLSGASNSEYSNNEATNMQVGAYYHFYNSTGPNVMVYNNKLSNFTTTSTMYYMYPTSITNFTAYDNILNGGNVAGTFYGYYCATNNTFTIRNNQIRNLIGNGSVYINYLTSLTGSLNQVYNNIYDNIGSVNAATGYTVYGLYTTHNTTATIKVDIYNNVFNRIYSNYNPSTATATRYLHVMYFGTTSNVNITYNIIHNTVQIDNSAAPNASSEVIYFSPTTTTSAKFNIRNNNFSDLSAAQTGVAKHYLIWNQGTTNVGNAATTFNNNNYYIANTTNGFVGYTSATDRATLADWKTALPQYDTSSIAVSPNFNSLAALVPLPGSPLVGAGSFYSGFTTDILGLLRNTSTPTIGAYENAADVVPPVISITPLTNVYNTSNRVLTGYATITDNIGVNLNTGLKPRLYYKKSTHANSFGANNSAFNGWKWVEAGNTVNPFDFTINYALLFGGSASTADTIQYFLVAQDTTTVPNTNVTAYPSSGFVGTTVANITSAPVPLSYKIYGSPARYLSTVISQPVLTSVGAGSTNNQIIRIKVQTATTGYPAYFNSLSLSTNGGGNDSANILNAKIWSTGADSNFAAVLQVGTTNTFTPTITGPIGAFSMNGQGELLNGTTYIWLTYDLRPGAVIGDSVDAQLFNINVNDTVRTVSPSTVAGARTIRNEYCTTTYASGCGTDYIARVRIGNLDNSTGCEGQYTFFNNVTVPNVVAGLPTIITVNYGPDIGQYGSAWIDYNDDGDFADPGEFLGIPNPANPGGNGQTQYTFTIPCNAKTGNLRLRIRGGDDVQPDSFQYCGAANSSYGEGEDYVINIVNSAASYIASTTEQITGPVAPGAMDARILKIPVIVSATPCLPGIVTMFKFNTIGTTNPADISVAKVYSTGSSSVFNTNKLVGTVYAPNGSFTFITNDTVVNDTNFYWLAYDVSNSATNNNLMDARIDSIQLFGQWKVPANNNPTGSRIVTAPMAYLGSSASHPELSKIEVGSTSNKMLKIMVRTSSIGAPISVTQFTLNTNGGGSDTTNILNAKMFYTGTSSTFSTTTQFGATYAPVSPTSAIWGSYNISGSQILQNDTNYFWLTYDIKPTANLGDSVDAAVTLIEVASIFQVPSITAPAGVRVIRAPYCASGATTTYDGEIWNVTVGSLNNTSTCTSTGGPGSQLNMYSNYSEIIAPPTFGKGKQIPFSINTATCGGNYYAHMAIFIDFNQDGILTDPGEMVYHTPTSFQYGTSVYVTGTFNIPCNALLGSTRMRVILWEAATSITPCGTFGYGETEDYTVTIGSASPSYTSSNTIQITGPVAAGVNDVQILKIPVVVSANACTPGTLSELRFNTIGTTTASNIVAAKVYATGGSNVFNTSKLLGTVYSPNGAFAVPVIDTLLNDTNFYWLTYDVSSTAANNNLLDARIDSIQILGNWRIPSNNNPAGSRIVSTPMTYVGSSSSHPSLSKVESGSSNNQILRIMLRTGSTGAPINATQFMLNTNGGGVDTANIALAKIYYTGNNSTFSSTNLFGSYSPISPTSANWGVYSINGTQALTNDTNYFWLVYDIKSTAIINDSVDAEVLTMTIGGIIQVPTGGAPNGNRKIRAPYCIGPYASACTSDDFVNNVYTSGGIFNISNLNSGCNGLANNYIYYPTSNLTVEAGGTFEINYQAGLAWGQGFSIYIDYNNNGVFDANETVAQAASSTNLNTSTITIPLSAIIGTTRLRVRCAYGAIPLSACSNEAYGETEDYNITILPAPFANYVWNTSGTSDFAIPTNWIPSRHRLNLSDKLVFSSGATNTITNVTSQMVKAIQVANNTTIKLNASVASVVGATDTLVLGNSSVFKNTNVTLSIGEDTAKTGFFNYGTSSGISGSFMRWVNTSMTNVDFPLLDTNSVNRKVSLSYTTAPGTSGSLTAGFTMTNPGNLGLPYYDATAFITVNRAGETGFWTLTPTGLAGGQYTGSFTANGFKGVFNYQQLILLNRAGSTSNWGSTGTHNIPSGSNAQPVLSRSAMTMYGQFGVGGDTLLNPLPVKYVMFTGTVVKNDVKLNWITATEINNKGFEVERSLDARTFTSIGFVKGVENSRNINKYRFDDLNAFTSQRTSVLYYRLRQVDLDGKFTYSNIIKVDKNDLRSGDVVVFPNPFKDVIGISIESADNSISEITIADMQGKLIYKANYQLESGSNFIELTQLVNKSAGVYFVKVNHSGKVSVIKINKTE